MANAVRYAALNMLIIFIGLILYTFLLDFLVVRADFSWLQSGEAYTVFSIQKNLGIEASFNSTEVSISYTSPAFTMRIIALCTGISELLFFAFLVLLFRGPRWKTKLKGLAVFLPAIFLINIARLLLIYPLALWLGVDAMWGVHWLIWKYGMFLVLMGLFTVWYLLWAKEDLQAMLKKR